MINWDLAIALAILAFVLPSIFLYFRMETLRQQHRNDFTEKEYLRRMLRDMEAHVRNDKTLFLEALGVPFLLMRQSGRVVMANSLAGDLLELDVACCPNLLKILPDGELRTVIAELLAEGQGQTRTLSLLVRGEERRFVLTSTPLGNADRHTGVVFHDVTEEYRTQVIRRDFVANASHELRTPMTILRGYLETLLENPADAADEAYRSRALSVMHKHVERITHLVEGMLTVSALENAADSPLQRTSFDFAAVAEDVLVRLESMIQRQQVKTVLDIEPCPFMMVGDRLYWSQILFNLVANALKYNPLPGLSLRITARSKDDRSVHISISDNGVGIEQTALPFIFNRFYRSDKSGKVRGSGLGLSIVRHAVEAHGGKISVNSSPGKLTVFDIDLPPQ